MLQIFVRMLLWTLALVVILIWFVASAAVWVIEALIAWRRKAPVPAFHMPRGTSDAGFGRTAAAAAAIVAVLALIGGSSDSSTAPAKSPATTATRAAATTPDKDRSTERETARKARAKRAAAHRAAKARAARERRRRERETTAAARPKPAAARACDSSYKGACLDPNAADYDCQGGSGDGPKYTGTVTVVGADHFDLDRDGDGTGCD